jgi:hypothetical protein
MAESVEISASFMDVELMRVCARIPESFELSDDLADLIQDHVPRPPRRRGRVLRRPR